MKNKNSSSRNVKLSGNISPNINQSGLQSSDADAVITPETPKGKGILATVPSLNNAAVIEAFQGSVMGKDPDLGAMIEMLEKFVHKVGENDLSVLEAMLVGQATALQTIFTSLARKASVQQSLPQYQTYMGLALKAQAQSRTAISALVDLKHPKQPSYIGQANLTTGPQQINNVIHANSKGVDAQNPPNQLSERSHELHQNPGAQSLEGKANSKLETLGAVYGAEVTSGQGTISHEGAQRSRKRIYT